MKYLLILLGFLLFAPKVYAVLDPLAVPNNRVGVHILDTNEIDAAAKLVNSNGGDWGYVTIPMRSNDRDREKWIKFFERCRQLHLIPIVRVATYPEGAHWVKPDVYDLVDFANFLSEMPWPTKNRYVVLFNEPNHHYEWGGEVNPFEYATLLVDAKRIFKERSPDYFLLSGGLDMSVPNSATSMEALRFYNAMTQLQPDWLDAVDGLSVHSYPNPGFMASVHSKTRFGITSYKYELAHLRVSKPVFITETGYIGNSEFFTPAFTQVWTDPNIVAITPFILFAGTGDFVKFSLLDQNHLPKKTYLDIFNLSKVRGSPLLSNITTKPLSGYVTSDQPVQSNPGFLSRIFDITNWFKKESPKLEVGGTVIDVEIADDNRERQQGLSGRTSLPENSGVLFVFEDPGRHGFWMKDMNFPLDFIWIQDGKIVEITENVPPPSQSNGRTVTITPSHDVDQVLEVNAGFVKSHNLQIGDTVNLSL